MSPVCRSSSRCPATAAARRDFIDRIGLPGSAISEPVFAPCFVSRRRRRLDRTTTHALTAPDILRFILDEHDPFGRELPYHVGRSRANRAVYGFSMGGFGALLVRPATTRVRRARWPRASPAVFPSYEAAITGHPAHLRLPSRLAAVGRLAEQTGVDGRTSRFGSTAATRTRSTLDRSAAPRPDPRTPSATISTGCHDIGFWRTQAARRAHLALRA